MKNMMTIFIAFSLAAGPTLARTTESSKRDLIDNNELILSKVEKIKALKSEISVIQDNIMSNSLILEATKKQRNLEVGAGTFATLLPVLFGVLPKNSLIVRTVSALTSVILGLFTKALYDSHEEYTQSQEARLEELNIHLDKVRAALDETEKELEKEYYKNSAILEAL